MRVSPLFSPATRLARALAGLPGMLLLAWLLAAPAWASTPPTGPLAPAPAPKGQPLADALNPDGTLKPGHNGSFDASGYQLRTAPDGRPVFRPTGTASGVDNWQDGFGLPGTNGTVCAVLRHGTELYIGGNFSLIGTVFATNIAKWNGTSWSAVGMGMTGEIRALAMRGTDLYAGGRFTTTGTVVTGGVAKWDGNAWSNLGTGMNAEVTALAVSGTDLYAGGDFTTAGGVAANRIAKWDGNAWSALGTGMNYVVSALAVSGTDLYAGGHFTTAGGVVANRIAKWNGSAWSALGTGPNDVVSALAVSGTDVYAGTASGPGANSIAKWDGSTWSIVGITNSHVRALAANRSTVYAGGNFTTVALNTSMGYSSKVTAYFGAYWPQGVPTATAAPLLAAQVQLYPNPASRSVFVELPAALSRTAPTVVLLDGLGRVRRTQVLRAGMRTQQVSLQGLAAGVYVLRLTTEQGIISRKLVVE